jgi:hypothetical protein
MDRNSGMGVGLDRVVLQTAKTMLLGALITTARLWIFTITVGMGYITLRI